MPNCVPRCVWYNGVPSGAAAGAEARSVLYLVKVQLQLILLRGVEPELVEQAGTIQGCSTRSISTRPPPSPASGCSRDAASRCCGYAWKLQEVGEGGERSGGWRRVCGTRASPGWLEPFW
ncbi:hypothetical protein PHYPSEUDO_013679 [Phytophthora pseudosyringae]|uniref:Uncharacterized protein n=1 Tax=Phytophthora pseudosyringae TaxID=221518 RepID=A0A8T1W6G6_9STRA|nr:hypothetical protein PHYPSEUDO_013679 [Phytophthora pseudosyringae]